MESFLWLITAIAAWQDARHTGPARCKHEGIVVVGSVPTGKAGAANVSGFETACLAFRALGAQVLFQHIFSIAA